MAGEGDMRGRWGGACVAGGHAWQGACVVGGHLWWGTCVVGGMHAGEMATEAGGMHSTGMHSYFLYVSFLLSYI